MQKLIKNSKDGKYNKQETNKKCIFTVKNGNPSQSAFLSSQNKETQGTSTLPKKESFYDLKLSMQTCHNKSLEHYGEYISYEEIIIQFQNSISFHDLGDQFLSEI